MSRKCELYARKLEGIHVLAPESGVDGMTRRAGDYAVLAVHDDDAERGGIREDRKLVRCRRVAIPRGPISLERVVQRNEIIHGERQVSVLSA